MKLTNPSWPVLLLTSLATSVAWAQVLTPAQFGDHELSVTNTLRVPIDRPPGGYDVSVTCQVIVETDGTTTSPHCLVDERYRSFQWEVIRAVTSAVMEPATIDGEPVRVLMSFTAGYRCLELCDSLLLSNHAHYVQDYGFPYSSPQPVLPEGTWYEGYDEKLAWVAGGSQAEDVGGIQYIVATKIDTRGRSSRRRVIQRSPAFWRAGGRAARSLDNVRYIPAFYEGQPIELQLYEYWLDPNGSLPETIELPVRVHLLSSEFVETLDTTVTDDDIRRFFDGVNGHWGEAGIHWTIESIVHTDAERQLAFRRITELGVDAEFYQLFNIFTTLCPRDQWLADGWNVCVVSEFPWVATHFGEGFVVMGEMDPRGEQVQTFALAREFGESLGAMDTPTCTARFLGGVENPDGATEGTCVTTDLVDAQIRESRLQAAKGTPTCPRPLRTGPAGGNWMVCALYARPLLPGGSAKDPL